MKIRNILVSTLNYAKKVVFGTLIVLDEEGNILLPSTPDGGTYAQNGHSTISQRLAKMRQNGSKVGCVSCKALTWVQNRLFRTPGDHCTDALAGFPDKLPTDG